jgi:AraC family transcriptional regulator
MQPLKQTVSGARAADRGLGECPLVGIALERVWRHRPQPWPPNALAVTRWRADGRQTTEVSTETPEDVYVIGITLRRSNLRFSICDRIAFDGVAMPGTLMITQPGAVASCTYQGPFDELHVHIPKTLMAGYANELPDRQTPVFCSETILAPDPLVEQLGRALLIIQDINSSIGQLYLQSISTAIVARLLLRLEDSPCRAQRKKSELLQWRLKRAIDYIESHLTEPLTLSDMAASTGLTRMHFAAQFRAATGLRPHEYLLRRRIERAQQLLLETRFPVVEIALSTGFQTQSHFTAVFTKFVGRPPRAWRTLHLEVNRVYQSTTRASRLRVWGALHNSNEQGGARGFGEAGR